VSDNFAALVGDYIANQRWFAGKGRGHTVRTVRTLAWLPGGGPGAATDGADVRVQVAVVEVDAEAAADGGVDPYQLPLSHRTERPPQLEHAYVGEWDGRHVYDALHDRDAVEMLVAGLIGPEPANRVLPPLHAHPVAERAVDHAQPTIMLTGEQSNSSVVVGSHLLLKVFRRVTPGRNPDIEVLEALTRAGSHEIVPLVGWLEADALPAGTGAGGLDLAMLSDFLRTATDGWDLALTSVRDLFAERDLHPDEVGGDFASESERLGVTTARLHDELARHLPGSTWGRDELLAAAARMRRRLHAAVGEVPELAAHAGALSGAFDSLGELDVPVAVQRVHGDFHLGQTLRTIDGWRVIDFEGEPATPLAERTALDSPVRDIAGMLRSFEYAAQSQWADLLGDHQLAQRALEWSERNRRSFLTGYAAESGADLDREQAVLLRAYETDKAVYEAVYEARNRPSWLPIPLRAVSRLAQLVPGGAR